MALDQGKLLKPFVAIYSVDYDEGVHYDDLEEIDAGTINPEDFGGEVAWNGATQQFEVTAGNLYWHVWIDEPYNEWISCDNDSTNQGDGSFSLEVMQNDGASNRQGQVKVEFTYEEDDYDHKRNTVFINVEQAAATVSDGYVTDQYSNVITALTASYNSGTVEYLYGMTDGEKALFWSASSESDWVSFGNTSCDWTNSNPTEVMVDSNTGDTRNANIVFNFYLDDNMESLVNTVVIPLTQNAAGQIADGSVDPSSMSLDANQGWQYFNVTAEDLYWMMEPSAMWLNNGQTQNGYGSNQPWFQVDYNPYGDRTGNFTFNFYVDDQYSVLKNQVVVTMAQTGAGEWGASFAPDYAQLTFNAGYDTGDTYVFMIGNESSYWEVRNPDGEAVASGTPTDTSARIYWDANPNGMNNERQFDVSFYDDAEHTTEVNTTTLKVVQSPNPNAPYAIWQTSGDFPASGSQQTFFIQNYENKSEYVKFSVGINPDYGYFPYGGQVDVITGNTADFSTGVTVVFLQNTGSTIQDIITFEFTDANDDPTAEYDLHYTVLEPSPEVVAVCTFETSSANETQNVSSYDGGNWMYAYIDGDPTNVLNQGTTQYEFDSAGTHTITYVREGTDLELQGWLQNNDAVSIELSGYKVENVPQPQGGWGFHGNENGYTFSGCTRLTGVTLDGHCVLFGKSGSTTGNTTFIGCTSLVSITCNGSTAPVNTAGTFETITGNTGTLHIPSGATSEYASLATDLGNNWTVVDDL